jgi:hypothetical protein
MSEIAFTSVLGGEHKQELERLLFFNDNQAKVSDAVMLVAGRYGTPRVQVVSERLRVGLESVQPQTLFAVRRTSSSVGAGVEPVGVMVYTREEDALVVLYLAVHEHYASRGPKADQRLLMRMTGELRGIARRVKGITSMVLFVGRSTPTRITISRDTGPQGRGPAAPRGAKAE